MDTQESKRLTLKDCKIDWKNHPAKDENGNPIIEDWTEHREQWLHEDCECNEDSLANTQICYKYYTHDYHKDKFRQYMTQERLKDLTIALWGLYQMFDDGWIKSPAFVDWRDFDTRLRHYGMYIFDRSVDMEKFIKPIYNPEARVSILKYFKDNIEYFIPDKYTRKKMRPDINLLLSRHNNALKVHNEELKRKAAAEKAKNKTPKEKPEYTLSLDEIIKYVREENPDSAHVIRAMLRFFAMEKSGWSTAAVKKRIEQINSQNIFKVEGDYIAGDKNVEAEIGNVEADGIGAQITPKNYQ